MHYLTYLGKKQTPAHQLNVRDEERVLMYDICTVVSYSSLFHLYYFVMEYVLIRLPLHYSFLTL